MKPVKNMPTNPELWSRAKAAAKSKYDVYPSAYANGFAAKWYKERGGNWKKMQVMGNGGIPNNSGFVALPKYVQQKIINNMQTGGQKMPPELAYARFAAAGNLDKLSKYGYKNGGLTIPMYADGGEPDGEMALGQINATINKLSKLRNSIQPNSDLEPWVSSKLTMVDDYTNSVSDYMMYNPETKKMLNPSLQEMRNGGIPERYKNMGFSSVGTKKDSTRPGKKWMVLAKKGEDYKVVHGGYQGMQDFKQHNSEQRRENFWNRMGGRDSAKATDPFSPLYWHKKFGTWQNGGQLRQFEPGGTNGGVQDHYVNTEPLVNKLKWGTPNPMLDTFQQQGQQIANQVGKTPYMEVADDSQNSALAPEPVIKTKTVREPFNQKYMMASNALFTGLDMLGKRNKNSYSNAMNDFNKNQSEYENNNVDLYSTSQDYYGKYEEGGTKNSLKTFYETMAQDPTYFSDELEALKDDYYQEVTKEQQQREQENFETMDDYINEKINGIQPKRLAQDDMTYIPYQAPQRRQIFSESSDDRMPYLPTYSPQLNVGFNAKPSDNAQFAYNYFQQSGLAPHQAAGLVGNFTQESNVNPNITNQIGAFGAGQWLGPRKKALLAYAKSKGKPANDLKTQLDFTLHELNTTEKKAGLALLKTKTPEQAALVVRKEYERPGKGEANDKKRIKVAQNLYYGKN
jgi:hypothetical protein